MIELSKAKWMTASCGILSVATFLALSLNLSVKEARRVGEMNQVSRVIRHTPTPVFGLALSNHADIIKQYGQLPLAFEPNWSSSSAQAKFLTRGNGYILFLGNNQALLELRGHSNTPAVVGMELTGSNSAPDLTPLEMLPGKSNYFIGNRPENWHVNIPQYRKVLERNVYHGVNVVYYGTQGQLEYDFDVAPGINPSVIQLAFNGTEDLRINVAGELVADTNAGEVRLLKPIAYQEIDGTRKPVPVGYVLKDMRNVSFQVAEYDSRVPLVIDPILSYSTYLGGSGIDASNAIAVAPDSTAFIAGSTFSTDFPTVHALQANDGGRPDFPQDAFVSKISDDGSTLLYSTYLGGLDQDVANGIAVDSFGNAYVTGTTSSKNFPVTFGAANTECGGDGECGASFNTGGLIFSNAFVTKLNAAGSGLIYSTYLGEYEHVRGQAIAVDIDGNAWVTGETEANGVPTVTITPPATPPQPFPITPTAIQTSFGGGAWDAFVTKIDPTGSTFAYSTYLGGNDEDFSYGIAVDDSSNIYVTGLTYSTNFPTTAPFQATYGGAGDAFVTKLNITSDETASVVYSTYLGGSGLDQANSIATDQQGNAYVAGLTNSGVLGFTPAGYQPVYHGEGDAFVAKLNNTGILSYFTYLGGSNADTATGIAVDFNGYAYVAGTTVSTNFPTAGAVFQPAYGGGNSDSFVSKLDPTGAMLLYSSYLGGSNTELSSGIAIDSNGSAYVTGQTCSEDFPLSNPLQAVPGGNCDAYIAKVSILAGIALNPAGLVFPAQSLNTTSQSQTVTLTNGDNPQTITSIAISGTNATDFVESNTCGSTLAVGTMCSITVSFTPSATGIRKASIVIAGSAPGSPQVINLTGNTSTVTLSTASLSFGFQQVGTPSSPQDVTVTNSGTTALTISSIIASGDFSETDNCTKAALQPTSNCVLQVTFTPSVAAGSVGEVTINDNGSGSPQEILVTGTGILEPQASTAPASLGFISQPIGATSAPQQVTLSNTGNAILNVASIVATGDFSQSSTCGSILSTNSSCSINVTFTPSAAGTRTGTLTITDNTGNVPGSTQTVPLSGTGQAVPVVTLSTNTLTFTGQAIGSTSAAQAVTLTNTGSASLSISNVTSSGDFAQVNNCPASVAVGGNCTINVSFTPSVSGNRFGSVTIVDNSANSPQMISMSGIGNSTPLPILSVASLAFGSQLMGTPGQAQIVGLTNSGNLALAITSIVATGDFTQTNNCGASVAAGSSCAISVTFTPSFAGARTGSLTVTDNAASPTQSVSLVGTGSDFQISSTTPSVTVPAGQVASYSISISSLGGFGQQVALSCGGAPVGATCSVSPNMVTPIAGTPQNATLTVTTGLRTFVPPISRIKTGPFDGLRHIGTTWIAWLIVALVIISMAVIRRRPLTAGFGFALLLLLASVACGGSSGSSTSSSGAGTPAGTYQITVTGTSGSVTSSAQVTLLVN